MIIHLFIDEKFIDYAINHFEQVAPTQNVFVVIVPYLDYVLKYIKQKEKVKIVVNSEDNVNKLMSELYQYDAIIFHSLFSSFFLKILHLADPNKIKLVWVFWGAEFYDHPLIKKTYIGKLTRLTVSPFNNLARCLKFRVNKVIKEVIKKGQFDINKNIKKITHVIAFEEDYNNVKKTWGGNAKLFWYSYYSIEQTVGSLIDKSVNGDNIFIGNSSSMSNNHLELFQALKQFNLGERKIIVPLSYGNVEYQNFIVNKGRKLWGDNFYPLLTFMEREEYNRCILGCNIVIMNHYRQQAVGNIVTSLWLGAKLFMSERSPIYKYFKKSGIILYSVEKDLIPNNLIVFNPLTVDEINNNKNILYKDYSLSSILNSTKLLVKELSA